MALHLSGSDVWEDYFSQNGSFVMNKHTYAFADMINNLRHMNRLLQIQADERGPAINKRHSKQCSIWEKDMHDFPSDAEMVKAWELGLM